MIIGITGSFGAGKGTVVKYLIEKHAFKHYSIGDAIREEIMRRNLPLERDSYIVVGNDLRAARGPAHLVNASYERARKEGGDAIIESLRAVAEVQRIKELGGVVLGVDAYPEIRYQHILGRGGEKDDVSFEQWLDQERRETNPNDSAKQDIFGALKESDYIIPNNGTVEELHTEIDEVLEKIQKAQKPPLNSSNE